MTRYLDFELEIGPGEGREYPVRVVRAPGGEASATMRFPFDELALENYLLKLQNVLLRSGGRRRTYLSPEEQAVQQFGQSLFDALFTGEVRSRYDVSLDRVRVRERGLRIKLRVLPPELAVLPWEFLYDPRRPDYISLSADTPIVRYLDLPHAIEPLTVKPPLRILAMVASPRDLAPLDVERERKRMEKALKSIQARGVVELHWLESSTSYDLQRALRAGPWHIFQFVGHGGFDKRAGEGFLALTDEDGDAQPLVATVLARLLADHRPLQLAILNACEGARGGKHDIFSSTASTLVRRRIPAVLAMQYEITDAAAIDFAHGFYDALADGLPVDAALTEARKSMSMAVNNSFEWGVPVLFMRSSDGMLFHYVSQVSIGQTERAADTLAPSGIPDATTSGATAPQISNQPQADERGQQDMTELLAQLAQSHTSEDWDSVIEVGESILKLDKAHPTRSITATGYKFRGLRSRQKDESELAIEDFTRALTLDPDNPEYFYLRGDTYGWNGEREKGMPDFDRAIALCDRIIEDDPNIADYYYWRGDSYGWKGDYEQCIADLSRAISLNPHKAIYYKERGTSYQNKQEFDRALADYSRAIDLDPNNVFYYQVRCRYHIDKGNDEQARKDFARILELDSDTAYHYRWRGGLYNDRGSYNLAITDYNQAIELAADTAEYYWLRGISYANKGDQDKAIDDYTHAIELNPNEPTYYQRRARSYHKQDRYDQAVADYTYAMRLDPNNVDTYLLRGISRFRQGDYDRAIANFDRAIEINPHRPDSYFWRAKSYLTKSGREYVHAALADLNRAIQLAADQAHFYGQRGEVFRSLGHYEQAMSDLNRALELDPNNGEFYYFRGLINRSMHDRAAARSDFQRAVECGYQEAAEDLRKLSQLKWLLG